MKGVKTWLKFLALFAMPLLCLCQSSDANAFKYDVQRVPLVFPSGTYYGSMSSASDQAFQVRATSGFSWSSSSIQQFNLGMIYEDNTCKGHGFHEQPFVQEHSDGTSTYSFGFLGFNPHWSQVSNWESINPCLTTDKMSSYDVHSVYLLGASTSIDFGNQLTSLLPYRFNYDGFYTTDTYNENGLNYDTKFDLHNVFGEQGYPDKISQLKIPFQPQSSVIDTLEPGTPINIEGEFIVDPDDWSQSFGLDSSTTFSLHTYYISNNQWQNEFSSCTWSFNQDDSNDPQSAYSLKYSCPTTIASYFDSSTMIPYFRLEIDFKYINNNTKLFFFIFDSSIVVTNNDYTPGGYFDDPVQGANTHLAPGSAYQHDYSDSTPNYESSLINMFNFNFFNPFSGIFNLFSDQNSCASIPTIAGMIHSQETTVCPWFDSTTRNIVTPVLGLASVMLIFGFAVRWLGARSGNLFEDSVDTDNYSFSNKFRRKK